MSENKSNGVLNEEYAIERLHKFELIFRYKVRATLVRNLIIKYLKKREGLNILDFGSAEGLTLLELNSLLPDNDYTGIEYSQDLIEKAPQLPENIRLIKGDVTNVDTNIKEKDYDLVIALALLEHLQNPVLAVKEAYDALKPGGLFIASSPLPFWENISTKLKLLRDDQHFVDINKHIIQKLIKEAGLRKLAYKRFMWSPVSILPYLKIKIAPSFSLKIDNCISKVFVFNWLFVNQAIIAQKPYK